MLDKKTAEIYAHYGWKDFVWKSDKFQVLGMTCKDFSATKSLDKTLTKRKLSSGDGQGLKYNGCNTTIKSHSKSVKNQYSQHVLWKTSSFQKYRLKHFKTGVHSNGRFLAPALTRIYWISHFLCPKPPLIFYRAKNILICTTSEHEKVH